MSVDLKTWDNCDGALPVWFLLLVLFKRFYHILIPVAVQNQKGTENSLVYLCDCSGNSPCYFLSPLLPPLFMRWGTVSSVGAQSLWDCTWWYSKPCENWTSAILGLHVIWLLRNTVLPMPPLPPKLKEKVCSLVLMIHYTSGLWNGCVWLAKLKFYFDGQLLYELELFVKNIQWFILIWRKK